MNPKWGPLVILDFGIRDWDLGLILENLGFGVGIGIDFEKFGIGIWDRVWKIRDLGFSFKNSGFGIGIWD